MAVDLGKRILVVSPQPDDEVVGCAHAMRHAVAAGAQVMIAHLTTGVPQFELALPGLEGLEADKLKKRMDETQAVAQRLGATLVWQGDVPSRRLPQNIFKQFWELNGLITHHEIDQLWVPAYEGGHVDHDTASGMGAATRRLRNINVLEYALYHRGNTKKMMAKPVTNQFLRKMNTEWIIKASPDDQKEKRALLAMYASEQDNLQYFGTAREMLRPQPNYNYAFAPHAGRPWYNQYWWVPFPHPRIDRTQPATVAQAIVNLLTAVTFADPQAQDAPQAPPTPPPADAA